MGRPKKLRWKEGDWGNYVHGLFTVSDPMLRRLRPDLFGFSTWFPQLLHNLRGTYSVRDIIKEHLWLGSVHPAMVLSLEPGRVAAYSSDLDCVAILAYSPDFLEEFGLTERSRLIGVNYYSTGPKEADIEFGPGKCTSWTGMTPIIAEFVTREGARLEKLKEDIPKRLWARTWELGQERIRSHPKVWRSGKPYASVPVE
jgi:hypothetical protein